MLAIYCRISQLKEEGKDRSIKEQRLLGIEKAKELNLSYKVFTEEGVSGTLPIEKRPELEKVISGIEDGTFTAMYIYLQDRLERNPEVRFYVNRILDENKAKLYTESGEVNLNDDDAKTFGDIQSIFNAKSVRDTKKRVKAVLKRNASEGKAHGIMPYGYTKDQNGYIIIDTEESKIVKRIYDMSLSGIGTNKIAETFSNEGILTRYNKINKGSITTKDHLSGVVRTTAKKDIKWAGNTIRNIVINTIYKGERHFGGEVYKIDNIVTPAYWQKVNDNLKNNRNNSGKNVEHKYLLKGLLICGRCGRNYYGRTRVNKKDNYYICSSKRYKDKNCGNRSINIDVLESFIWNLFFVEEELIKIIIHHTENSNTEEVLKSLNIDLKTLNKMLENNKAEKRKVVRLAVKGLLTDEELIPETKRIKSEKDDLGIKIENLQNEKNNYQNISENAKSVIDEIKSIYKDSDFNVKRDIIKKHIKNIEVNYFTDVYSLNFQFNFVLSNEDDNFGFSYYIDRNYHFAEEGNSKNLFRLSKKANKWNDIELCSYRDKVFDNYEKEVGSLDDNFIYIAGQGLILKDTNG